MEGRWVTIRGRHIFVDDKGFLRPGGPEAAAKAHWNTAKHQWRRAGVVRWPTEKPSETSERSWTSRPANRGMAHRTPGDTERPAKSWSGTTERSWAEKSPADKEREYWKTHGVATAAQQKELETNRRTNEQAQMYKENFHRAGSEWFRDMERDFEAAQSIGTVIETAPKALSAAKTFLRNISARGVAGAIGHASDLAGAAARSAGRPGAAAIADKVGATARAAEGFASRAGGGLSAEGLGAKRAADAAVARAEAAVERAAKAADQYGSTLGNHLRQTAVDATKQARVAVAKVEPHVREAYAAEAVRRVSQPGALRGAEAVRKASPLGSGRQLSDAEIEQQAREGAQNWAIGTAKAAGMKVRRRDLKGKFKGFK